MDALKHEENCHDRDHGVGGGGGNEGLQATNLGNCARKLTLGVTTMCHVMARLNPMSRPRKIRVVSGSCG